MATFDVGIIFTAVNNAKGAFASMNRDLNKVDQSGKKVATRMRAIQAVFAGIAIGAGIQFAKTITTVVGEMELLIARLAAVEGGTTAARATLGRLTDQFAKTPFAIDAVANGFTRLRAAGLGTEDAFKTLSAGVDAVAAFGGSTAELNRFIIGLQQSIGKGTLSMEELRQQIGEAVPSAMRVLAREMDISIGELFTRIEKGTVDSLEAVSNLTTGLQKDFGGIAQSFGDKILGAIKSNQSKIKIALEETFNVNTDAGAQTVRFINDMGAGVIRFIQSIKQGEVDNFFAALRAGAGVVANLVQTLRVLINLITDLSSSFHAILGDFGSTAALGGLIGFMLFGKFGAAAGAFLAVLGSITGGVDSETGKVSGIVTTITTGLTFGLIGKAMFGKFGPAALVAAAGTAVSQIGDIIKTNRADKEIADNLGREVARVVGDKGREAGIKFLEMFIAEGEKQGFAEKVANTIMGRQGTFEEGMDRARALLGNLRRNAGETAEIINKASSANKKAMEEVVSLVTRGFGSAVEKLIKLQQRAETATFTFGGGTAQRMENTLKELLVQRDILQKNIAKFEEKFAGRVLTEEQTRNFENAKRNLADFDARVIKVRDTINAGVAEGTRKFVEKTTQQFNAAKVAVDKFGAALGTDLEQKVAQVDSRFVGLQNQLQKVAERMKKANDTAGLAAVKALQQQLIEQKKEVIAQLETQARLQERVFAMEQKGAQLQISANNKRLAREQRTGLAAAFSSDFADTADDRRLSLKQSILAAEQQIAQLEVDKEGKSAADKAAIQGTQDALLESIKLQQQAMKDLSAEGLLAQAIWKQVGDAIQTSVKSSLKDLVKGTFNAKEALLSFYDAITDAAIDYLIELIKIQFRQQLLGAAGGGGGGGGLFSILGSFLGGFANGGAFKGGITPFADGGIVRGPTMFGLAGEAGDEAIMPLTRIGGQLGVRSEGGGGGDNFSITIQAIDTQTGAQFLQRNASTIVQQVRHQGRLNNGSGTR